MLTPTCTSSHRFGLDVYQCEKEDGHSDRHGYQKKYWINFYDEDYFDTKDADNVLTAAGGWSVPSSIFYDPADVDVLETIEDGTKMACKHCNQAVKYDSRGDIIHRNGWYSCQDPTLEDGYRAELPEDECGPDCVGRMSIDLAVPKYWVPRAGMTFTASFKMEDLSAEAVELTTGHKIGHINDSL